MTGSRNRLLAVLLAATVLAGCASFSNVEGEQRVGERLLLTVDRAWNKVVMPGDRQPYETWTQEGLPLDHLRLWPGLKPGDALMAVPPSRAGQVKDARVPTFARGLRADQVVELFEQVYAADGSTVRLLRAEPSAFAGIKGVRFEFELVRKSDEVRMRGIGWAGVGADALYAATFVAPRLSFYGRLAPQAEAVVRSARLGS